ncbi:MAG: hypothetical protein ACFBSD_06255 [Paracoccaceae bacterium]
MALPRPTARGLWIIAGLVLLATGLAFLPQLAIGMLAIVFALAMVGGLLFLTAVIFERIRQRRADRDGFSDFVARGAPHQHRSLILALMDGATEGSWRFTPVPLGQIELGGADARPVFGDPSVLSEELAEGRWRLEAPIDGPFQTVVLLHAKGADQRLAALAVVAPGADLGQTARLEPAWADGDRAHALETRWLPELGVDSATLAVGALEAWKAAAARIAAGTDPGHLFSVGPADGTNPYLSDDPRALCRVLATGGGILLVVMPGMGDGAYPLWRALDREGATLALIADFGMLEDGAEPSA